MFRIIYHKLCIFLPFLQGVLNIDPIRILFFIKKNLRIIDLFRQIDVDHSASVSRDEVRKALLVSPSHREFITT